MSERKGVLAAGSWIVDHVKMIDVYPGENALALISAESPGNGGGAYNMVKDLALMGAGFPLYGAGLVGDDADGHRILEDCSAHGIDATRLTTSDRAMTSYTDVMTVTSSGKRTFFHHTGANAILREEDVHLDGCPARFFFLGYLLLLDALDEVAADGSTGASRLLQRASDAGFETMIDLVSSQAGNFREVVTPALRQVDYMFLNEFEAGSLLGREIPEDDPAALLDAATAVLDLGVRKLVILHSAKGGVMAGADGTRASHASVQFPEEEIKGAAGAGDAFAVGVTYGLHEGLSAEECLRTGVCLAASNLRDATCSGGILPRDEALALGEEYGFREW
ncbi:MAG: carbohydrate kinase family protein [Akkermansiaceae bacterium]|nr:carbohydrate kinase family protein [Akkermansiaceae bacterium]NNM30617.1 carbohydrate kinase family protein [Akkermansiaceae bacterium]